MCSLNICCIVLIVYCIVYCVLLVGEENVMCDVPLIVPITPSVTALNITIPCHTIKS